MGYNLSACTFIRNTFSGFCLFESMACWLPLVDEFVVLDLGSDDGTLDLLRDIAAGNPKIKIHQGAWPSADASAFAVVMNDAISLTTNERVIAYQADEIPHEDLLKIARAEFEQGHFDLSFWRYQLKENFQVMKWCPHPVHRVGVKGQFEFVDDGMNTSRTWDAHICSSYDGGWFTRWGSDFKEDYTKLPTNEMILDVGKSGAFREIVAERAELHFPFWRDGQPNVDGTPTKAWGDREKGNNNWTKEDTPFNIPKIMMWHLGKPRYYLRRTLFEALRKDATGRMVGL